MNISTLKSELLSGHPVTGAYDADDALAADQINLVNRTKNRTSISASEVVNAFDSAEFTALSDANKALVWNIVHIGELNPFGIEATLLTSIFGGGSNTIVNLAALRTDNISRADELGLGVVGANHIELSRRS